MSRRSITLIFLALCIGAFLGFTALGVWQLQRLQWKLDLIDRVESRINASPASLASFNQWSTVNRENNEYQRVSVTGQWLSNLIKVKAVTELGDGFWILSPLQLSDGSVVLVNRGFAPKDWQDNLSTTENVDVIGLIRMTEPDGAFLRHNDATNQRWFSRDVDAIASANNLKKIAPFFIDAETISSLSSDRLSTDKKWPKAGLTVVKFRNSHLVYALTWFGLAALTLWAIWQLLFGSRNKQAS